MTDKARQTGTYVDMKTTLGREFLTSIHDLDSGPSRPEGVVGVARYRDELDEAM